MERPGCGQTRSGSFLNEPALDLGQRGEDVEDEFPGRCCGIDRVVTDRSKADALVAQLFDECDQMRHEGSAHIRAEMCVQRRLAWEVRRGGNPSDLRGLCQ